MHVLVVAKSSVMDDVLIHCSKSITKNTKITTLYKTLHLVFQGGKGDKVQKVQPNADSFSPLMTLQNENRVLFHEPF